MQSPADQFAVWLAIAGIGGFVVALAGLVIATMSQVSKNAHERGVQDERLRRLREEHDNVNHYAHDQVHEIRNILNTRLGELEVKLARHGINGKDD